MPRPRYPPRRSGRLSPPGGKGTARTGAVVADTVRGRPRSLRSWGFSLDAVSISSRLSNWVGSVPSVPAGGLALREVLARIRVYQSLQRWFRGGLGGVRPLPFSHPWGVHWGVLGRSCISRERPWKGWCCISRLRLTATRLTSVCFPVSHPRCLLGGSVSHARGTCACGWWAGSPRRGRAAT